MIKFTYFEFGWQIIFTWKYLKLIIIQINFASKFSMSTIIFKASISCEILLKHYILVKQKFININNNKTETPIFIKKYYLFIIANFYPHKWNDYSIPIIKQSVIC